MNTGAEGNHLEEAIRDFLLEEAIRNDDAAEWNTTSLQYPKISDIGEPVTVDGIVKHAAWEYRRDGRAFCALELTDGTAATDTSDDVDVIERYDYLDGYKVRLTGRWADVELLHPEHPLADCGPPPGRWFLIEALELQERVLGRSGFGGDE